jgi:hypothetical protein
MYQVIDNNRVRKMPEMEKPDFYKFSSSPTQTVAQFQNSIDVYENLLLNAPEFPISGNHNLKEGQLIPDDEIEIVKSEIAVTPDLKERMIEYIAIPKQTEPSTGSEEDKAARIRKLAWQTFKEKGFTISKDEEVDTDNEQFCFYEQGFADAFKHIFKTNEELKTTLTQ